MRGALLLLLTFVATSVSAQTITQPAAQVNVRPAKEYATQAFGDPINMSERTDVGWFLYSADQPRSNLGSVSMTGGRLTATSTSNDPNLFVLETGNPVSVKRGRRGDVAPIDANQYRTIALRMRLSGTSQGVRASDGQLIWNRRTIYDSPTSVAGSFWTYGGWQVYFIDIPTLGLAMGDPWSGSIGSLRLDPTVVSGQTIEIDWIRLVSNDAATFKTITWSGSGGMDIYLDSDRSDSNGTLGMIAKNATTIARNVSGGSFQFQPGALPAGDYYVAMRPSGTSNALRYSPGFYRVEGTPTFVFTSPSEEGSSDDFATARLGNAWDMNATSDVDATGNVNGLSITTITAETPAGTPLGSTRVLQGSSLASGATADPILYLLAPWKRGASAQIDSNRYRILTFELGLPGARNINAGSIARVAWRVRGEGVENVSEDIVINHRAGANVLDKVIVDMKKLPLEGDAGGSPSRTGWNGSIELFRIDPHEFTPATNFSLRRVKLAALERTGSSYRLAWNYDANGADADLALYYDLDGSGFNGFPIVTGLDPASGAYTWNTTALAAGQEYHVYGVLTAPDGTVLYRSYGPWPVVAGGTGSAGPAPAPAPAPAPPPATSQPAMALDAPGEGAVLPQPFFFGGWAIDLGATSNAGVDTVHVWAYPATGAAPIFVGAASYGGARPDLGGMFGPRFTPSGFGLHVRGLAPGRYQLVAFARSTVSRTFNNARAVNVTVTAQPMMAIDTPANGQAVATRFLVGGWAIDRAAKSGTGVNAVHVWAYPSSGAAPVLVGVAQLGGDRPDVAAVFGPDARRSGYNLVASLAPGTYDLVVFAHSTVTNSFSNAQVVRITVR